MAEPLTINVQQAAKTGPCVYTVPGSAEVEPLSAFATFDGSAASGAFLPTLTFRSAGGLILARVFPSTAVGVGASADVTFAPAMGDTSAAAQSASIFRRISTASTNAASVKATAGQIVGWVFSNQNLTVRYLKLYDKASAPTVGTDVPVMTIAIPGGATGHVGFPAAPSFSTGIAMALTTGVADADATAVAANDIVVNLLFQ